MSDSDCGYDYDSDSETETEYGKIYFNENCDTPIEELPIDEEVFPDLELENMNLVNPEEIDDEFSYRIVHDVTEDIHIYGQWKKIYHTRLYNKKEKHETMLYMNIYAWCAAFAIDRNRIRVTVDRKGRFIMFILYPDIDYVAIAIRSTSAARNCYISAEGVKNRIPPIYYNNETDMIADRIDFYNKYTKEYVEPNRFKKTKSARS